MENSDERDRDDGECPWYSAASARSRLGKGVSPSTSRHCRSEPYQQVNPSANGPLGAVPIRSGYIPRPQLRLTPKRGNSIPASGEELLDNLTAHVGQPKFPPQVFIRQARMVDAQAVENGGMQIVDVDGIGYYVVTVVVGFAELKPRLTPPPAIHMVKQRGWWSRP